MTMSLNDPFTLSFPRPVPALPKRMGFLSASRVQTPA